MNKRHYEHTLPNIRGSLSNTYKLLLLLLVEFFSGELLLLILLCFSRKSWADFSRPAAERRPAPG